MKARLIVTEGKANQREVSVTLPVVIGRSRSAGLTIGHAMVSRLHCEIYEVAGLVRIRDLGSTNGTFVGGERVEEAVLRPRDQFTIGPLTFEVDYAYADDSTIVDQQAAGLVKASSPEAANAAAEPAYDSPANAAPPADAISPALLGEAGEAGEDFELAGPAEASSPGEACEVPAALVPAEEPSAEFAEPGPEIPPLPLQDADPPEGPDLGFSPSDPDGTLSAASPFRELSGGSPFGGEGVAPEANDLPMDFLDSETAPWEPSGEDSQPTPLPPRLPPRKPKKSRWWPFGRRK